MVTHALLRAALLLSLLPAAAEVAAAQPVGAPPVGAAPAPGVVVGVDLGAGSDLTERAAAEVAAAAGLAPVSDLALLDVLGDRRSAAPLLEASADVTAAEAAYGRLDCAAATAVAGRAVVELAAVEAAGMPAAALLPKAYVYLLLCADGAGDASGAQLAADRLRAVGADPPAGVPPAVWARYPGTDATTNRLIVALTVESTPAGAAVWIDHRAAGTAPVVVHLAEGEHLVAVASPDGAAAQTVTLAGGAPRSLQLPTPELIDRWPGLRVRARAWRAGEVPDGAAIAGLVGELGVTAVLLARPGAIEVWALAPGASAARLVAAGRPDEAAQVGRDLAVQLAAWSAPSPVPPLPTAVEKHRPWWVYASLAGAVAVAAGVILAGELADDRQRIQLSWP